MKKVKCLLFVLLLFLTVNVKATSDCDSKELARLKELAKKVEFDYNYKLKDDQVEFSINAVNLNSELKVLIIEDYYSGKYKEFKDSSTHAATLTGFKEGERVNVTIKGFVPNWCSGETLTTKSIKLPYYNKYYDEAKCKGNENFKYCKLLVDKKLTEEEYNKQFDAYLKNNNKSQKPTVNPENDNTKLYLIIGGSVLVVVIITFVVISMIKRKKKNSL